LASDWRESRDGHLDGSESSPANDDLGSPLRPIFRLNSTQYDAAARGLRPPVHPCRANCALRGSPSPDDDDDRLRRCQQSHAFTPIDVAVDFQQIPVLSTGTFMELPVLPRDVETSRPACYSQTQTTLAPPYPNAARALADSLPDGDVAVLRGHGTPEAMPGCPTCPASAVPATE
jgi:hypothetical protein